MNLKLFENFSKLDISFISNLGTNAGVMAANGLDNQCLSKVLLNIGVKIFLQRKLYPEITANCVIAWRRNIPHSEQ